MWTRDLCMDRFPIKCTEFCTELCTKLQSKSCTELCTKLQSKSCTQFCTELRSKSFPEPFPDPQPHGMQRYNQ